MIPLATQISLDRMVNAVEKVRRRLLRATAALTAAGIPYAVAGGNAIAAWVSSVDEAAVRNTQDVDILVRRSDFAAIQSTLESSGFIYRRVAGIDAFLDAPGAKVRDAVHIIFAGERVRPDEPAANPDLQAATNTGEFSVLDLQSLVQIKLTAWRDKDRTHLRDLIEVGLIDSSWPARFPGELGNRLQALLDTPNG
jgi:hypothetical protein